VDELSNATKLAGFHNRIGFLKLILSLCFVIELTVVHVGVSMGRAEEEFTSTFETSKTNLFVALETARNILLDGLF